MHVWATGNGVASTEKRDESPSFDKKKPLQENLTPQCRAVSIFQAKSFKLNRIKYSVSQGKGKKESYTSFRIESCFQMLH
tara:strand:+ start:1275 stop:1514 length:240 start_codon:yes stop_codon:yes gene_type:complete